MRVIPVSKTEFNIVSTSISEIVSSPIVPAPNPSVETFNPEVPKSLYSIFLIPVIQN